ncbi:Ankyrin-3 [Colletotrichum siamense]|uniref:Ankyrin-3 n=1 Tax=Colletotrichum siamense TaxID=690259 RepID=A0A9P5BR27_COLSI|nr:Ankyrin-3 [Colletotrichum siamense]KAF4848881.1 Ankyrin-3 [Colletotrichum siamense]
MAEILGIAAAAIQLTELTIKILSEGYAFLNKTVGAPTEIRQLLTETAALDCLLSRLRDLSHPTNPAPANENVLLRLEQIGVEDGERVRNIAKRLTWSLRAQKEVQESLDRLRRMKETLSTALETNTALAIDRIETKVNQTDWQRVFSWVCPVTHLQTQDTLQDLLSRRHPGSGLWLVESEAFGNWVNDRSEELLWITGLPGAGKSVLCATAVETLSSMMHLPGAIMVYFFCSFEESEKAALHFLMSIAAQFVSQSQRCFDIASKRQKDKNGFSLTIGEFERHLDWFLKPAQSPRRYRLWQAVLQTSPGMDAVRHSAAPIIYAIANDLHILVDVLLPTLDDVNGYFLGGSTCLLITAIVNNVKLARQLLSQGAGVDFPDKMRQLTPLHVAAEHGSEEMVELLLEHGASPFARSDSGTTPFYRAARDGSTKTLRLLYDAGSELDAKTWDLWTPLMEAVENGNREAIKLLLSWGADAGNVSRYGTTPLDLASKDLAPLIIEAGGGPGEDRSPERQEGIGSREGNHGVWRPARIG